MSILLAERLTARYPGQPAWGAALAEINLEVQPGERLLLVGPNGAGKSTFIRVFAGLMRTESGTALVAGEPARKARGSVGVVAHATYLYDELTAAENLRLYGQLYGVEAFASRATELLSQVGMMALADVPVGRLSRGQQQRVAIARALVHDPPLLLLDEPDTGLDAAASSLLAELVTTGGRTVVLTTHNLSTGLRLSTRAAVLARGRLMHEQVRTSPDDAGALTRLVEELAR